MTYIHGCSALIGTVKNFLPYTSIDSEGNPNYIKTYQTFTAPCSGTYKIEAWGAQGIGGHGAAYAGHGGYVSGEIFLNKDKTLYIYVGSSVYNNNSFVWNGSEQNLGGGATDIRYTPGLWNNFNSLKARIMVAAGGGVEGVQNSTTLQGGHAGGLVGYSGQDGTYLAGGGATQTAPGTVPTYGGSRTPISGGFGYGGYTTGHSSSCCPPGNGYYGGGTSTCSGELWGAGGGGSSFISGHNGCNAINESSTASNITHSGTPNHYSGMVFSNTTMIDGAGYGWTNVKGAKVRMPKPSGGEYSLGSGNSDNGYARITIVE